MPPTRVLSLDYTSRDKEAILADFIRSIPQYTPEWTDHNPSDFGIVALNQLAAHLDVLHFYVDRMAAESFITTCVKRESIIRLLRLIGFELRSIVPASVDVTFSLTAALTDPVLIPAGTKIQTVASENLQPVLFETAANLTIPALSLTGSVSAIEGEAGEEPLGTSNGQSFQSFPVAAAIIVEGSLKVFVDEGSGEVEWALVNTLINSGPTAEVYRIERDASEVITVFFGDGLTGKIPVSTASVRAEFRAIQGDRGGPGVFGNVGAGTIKIVQDTIFVGGRRVSLSVVNPQQASGGEDRQSIEEARRLGPASLLALGRAVTAADYKTLVEQFGGVAKAKVVQGISGEPCCACNLDIYVAPTGGGVASTTLKNDLLDYLEDKKMVGTCIVIQDPTYVDVDIEGTVFVAGNQNLDNVQDEALAALVSFFSLDGEFADFDRDMFLGNLFAALEGVSGVDHVDLTTVTRRPVPVLDIWNGDGAFGAVQTGQASQEETWTVTFVSPTTFSVQGSVSGLQTNGTVNTAYTSDNGEVTFTVTSGVTPNQVGDKATFVTSKKLGNVPISPVEIMEQGTTNLTFVLDPNTSVGTSCA